jgi:nitroreductase
MEFLDLVIKRQSIRDYSSRPVSRQDIDKCLEAARFAPSACNSQPWSFIVLDKEEIKNRFADKAFSGIYAVNSFAKKAPVIIVVVTERSAYAARLGSYFRGTQYNLIDVGISCEHLVLQAAELGIGTCWHGWFNEKAIKKFLGLPMDKKVDVLISMGYPKDEVLREKKRKSLDEIRRYQQEGTT